MSFPIEAFLAALNPLFQQRKPEMRWKLFQKKESDVSTFYRLFLEKTQKIPINQDPDPLSAVIMLQRDRLLEFNLHGFPPDYEEDFMAALKLVPYDCLVYDRSNPDVKPSFTAVTPKTERMRQWMSVLLPHFTYSSNRFVESIFPHNAEPLDLTFDCVKESIQFFDPVSNRTFSVSSEQ